MATACRTVRDNSHPRILEAYGALAGGTTGEPSADDRASRWESLSSSLAIRLCFQHFNESLLRNVDGAERLHALLAFLLFLEQLPFARDITAITFGGHIFSKCTDGFTRNNLSANRGLDRHLILLMRNNLFQFR